MSSPSKWFLFRQWLSRIIFPEVWEWYEHTVVENEYLYRHAEEGGMNTDKFFEFTDTLAGVDDETE